MKIDFKHINYLKEGNEKQQRLYNVLNSSKILIIVQNYQPIVVGTIPIEIDIETSDVDIILKSDDFSETYKVLTESFSNYKNFKIDISTNNVILCNFELDNFLFEIYVSTIETTKQNAYLHMIKEYEILQIENNSFKNRIIQLKKEGIKTEPAFCKLLNIEGNPYIELLNYQPK